MNLEPVYPDALQPIGFKADSLKYEGYSFAAAIDEDGDVVVERDPAHPGHEHSYAHLLFTPDEAVAFGEALAALGRASQRKRDAA
jgi:hypothetical protein